MCNNGVAVSASKHFLVVGVYLCKLEIDSDSNKIWPSVAPMGQIAAG